ncbi:hypothetical protein [Clostridium combesii]|uniref:DUF4364 domain-containing protein n=1 Tax=Clostridium combesii TaxID=39481 RepID=A0A2G7HHU0_9CLOT|nr:hypothetical protein [Clostridium combesii]PIH04665.1 hypothetical protein CS538_08710 [Clostridium combesii]
MRGKLNNSCNYLTLNMYLLFNNEYLDLMTLLCVMYNLKNKRKGLTLDEILLYYLIIASEVDINILENKINVNSTICKYDTDIKYIQSINKIKKSLNILLAKGYIDFFSCKNEVIRLKINAEGINTVKSLKSSYYKRILTSGSDLIKQISYTKNNVFKILGVRL